MIRNFRMINNIAHKHRVVFFNVMIENKVL
jgi:hypothetical protein